MPQRPQEAEPVARPAGQRLKLGRSIVVPVAALEALLCLTPSQPEAGTLNRVELTGRLTRDPDRRQARNGLPMVVLRLAVPHRNDDTAVFIDVVAFGTVAQHAGAFAKGQPVRVGGRLDHREWTTEDGSRRSAHQIVAWSIDALELPVPGWEPVAS